MLETNYWLITDCHGGSPLPSDPYDTYYTYFLVQNHVYLNLS
jgi:hypothetical protein